MKKNKNLYMIYRQNCLKLKFYYDKPTKCQLLLFNQNIDFLRHFKTCSTIALGQVDLSIS